MSLVDRHVSNLGNYSEDEMINVVYYDGVMVSFGVDLLCVVLSGLVVSVWDCW